MSDVFISYSRKDSDFVRRLNDALVKTNLKVWVDWEDIARGEDWWHAIQEGVEKADTALIVVSENWLTSEVCHRELDYVRQQEKRIFPIIRQQIRGDVELRSKGSWMDQNWEQRARDNWKELRTLNWMPFDDDAQFEASFAGLLKAIEEDQPYIKAHTRYQTHALEWERSKQNPGFLLIGDDLTFAQKWLTDSPGLQPVPTHLQRTFIAASKAAEDTRQAREALREQSIKQFRRAAIGLVAVVVVAVIAAVITGISAINSHNQEATSIVQIETATVAFSTATRVAQDSATISSNQVTAQFALTSVQATLGVAGSTLTAVPTLMNLIAETMTASDVQQDIFSLLARGLLLVNYKDNQQAVAQAMDTADQIISRHADVPFAFVASGLIKERAGNIEQAIEDYGVAIALNPYYSAAYSYRAAVYESQKKWSLAIDDYGAIIQINSDSGTPDSAIYMYRGSDYNQLQDYQNALKDFDKAISLKKDYALAYYERGLAYNQLQDYQNAVTDFNMALSLNVDTIEVYYWRGRANGVQGNYMAMLDDWHTYEQQGGQLSQDEQSLRTQVEATLTAIAPPATPTP